MAPEHDKAATVRAMFDRVAPRYDLFNDVLSLGVHRRWRRRAIEALTPRSEARYLDLCAGTLDMAAAILDRAPEARVVAVDFSLPMLAYGAGKLGRNDPAPLSVSGDALALPFAERSFAGCVIGFGLRNLIDPAAGLIEMRRILEPGGRVVVLEFTTPPGRLFRRAYHLYFHHILPLVGGMITGDLSAARYLPNSVARFPDATALAELLCDAGFADVRYRFLTRGIAVLHSGTRA